MRFAKPLLSLALLTVCFATLAQASVLLPEDNDVTSSGNLGLNSGTKSATERTPSTEVKKAPAKTAEETMDIRQLNPAQINQRVDGLPQNIDDMIPEEVKKYLPNDYKQAFKDVLKDPSIQNKIQAQKPAALEINTTPFSIKPTGQVKNVDDLSKDELVTRRMRYDYNRNPKNSAEEFAANMYAKELAAGEREPTFLNEYVIKNPTEADLMDELSIQVRPDYVWGERELRMIENALGFTPEQVAKSCQIRLDATVKGSGTGSTFRSTVMAGGRGSFKYNAPLISVELKGRAICLPPQTYPKRGAVITRTGDKVSVVLGGQMTCAPAEEQRATTSLIVKYLGEGKMQCAFK